MPELVGRQRELSTLGDVLTAATEGRGSIVLAIGEPGIGKTRLLEAAAADAAQRGFAIAWGRAWEVSSAPPYWPWIEALRDLAARGTDASAIADVLPEVARRPPTASTTDPLRLYDGVVAFLHAACAREPIAIVLDDLHATDPSTLRLAELVAPHIRRMRAVLLGSYRDVEARRTQPVQTALARLERHAETLHLSRLDVPSVAVLVRERLGRDDAQVARMIHDASDGNPLFAGELLKLVAARGSGARQVPAGVRAVIRERLGLLSPATVALLQASAIIGREFGLTVPAELAGVTPAALEEAVEEAAAAEVVELMEAGRYRFSHALVAETLVADLAPGVRAKLHRRAAETLERAHAGDPAAPLTEIARHWLAAGAEHAERAVAASVAAARTAQAGLAFDDAAALYENALTALSIAAPGDVRMRAELLIAQGDAYVRGGDRARATAPCKLASELAAGLGDGVLFARAALAYGADAAVASVDATLVALLERALTLLPQSDDPWRAKVAARLAAARQPSVAPDHPVALARDAIAMARRLGDRTVLRDVLFYAAGALVDYATPAERAACNAELLDMLDGDTPRTLRTLQRLAFDQIELADLAGFERTVAHYETLGAGTGQLRYQWAPLLFRAMRAHWEGRRADADRLSEQAYAIRERLGEELMPMRILRTCMLYGFAAVGDDYETPIRRVSGTEVTVHTMLGWAYLGSGRIEDARRECAWLRAHREPGEPVYHALDAYAAIAWAFRDRELAARHQLCARPYAGRAQLVSSVGFMFHGVIDHGLMRTALVLDDIDEAQRYRDSALALCDRLGARPLRELIERDWAEARDHVAPSPSPAGDTDPAAAHGRVHLQREGEYWTVSGLGELCRIKDSRGMQMLARLVAEPKCEHHVLDLVGAELVDAGDAGTVIDRTARDRYVARIKELQAELAEANDWNDRGRQQRLGAELDALGEQLASAYGLGGREKRAGSATERARTNARRRLADAMQRIDEAAPALGRHFARAIKTGFVCSYDPDR